MEKQLKGIALLLFGLSLCASDYSLNRTLFSSSSDVPFALAGIIVGAIGMYLVFANNSNK